MVEISFCVFLMIRIFLLVLEQLLRSPYVYTVYLVDLLVCLTKDQLSSIDICVKSTPRRYNFKLGFQNELSFVCLMEQFFFHCFITTLHRKA